MPNPSYLGFVFENRRFLLFGFFTAFGSSFGQTFFIGIFGPHLQSEFGLSHTLWGTIYLVGTLGSAALLPWTGKLIDRVALPVYSRWVSLSLAGACVFFALVSGPLMLVVAIFLLRQAGQGLTSHIAMTSMARYFSAGRGRAIAIATAGFSTGEALLPFLAVVLIAAIGWRYTYVVGAVALILVGMPVLRWLLRGHAERDDRLHQEAQAQSSEDTQVSVKESWSRSEVLRDPRFYLLVPAVTGLSIVGTALFFHHLNLADYKGWSHEWMTGSYVVYSIATVLTALISGSLVDRFSAARLIPFMPLPMLVALAIVAVADSKFVLWVYFTTFGICTGMYFISVTAMWAEIYGVAYIGAIKSMVSSVSVFGSAVGPVIMGGLMDLGLAITHVCMLFAAYMGVSGVLAYVAVHMKSSDRAKTLAK